MPSPPSPSSSLFDVCIVGAGPAGLNAALVLGRCGRNVLVFDSGQPRNIRSRALHGFLTRDGTHPVELRALGRAELAAYPTVQLHDVEVVRARRIEGHFEIELVNGSRFATRVLLLATGRYDRIPELPGFERFYGRDVHHCPYCDGWEHRGETLVVHGRGPDGYREALLLLTWSHAVTLCTDGPDGLDERQRQRLRDNGIAVIENRIATLAGGGGDDDRLTAVTFHDRAPLPCGAVFFCGDCVQHSALPRELGCEFDADGNVRCDGHAATNVPSLYVAGNVRGGVHLAIVAAAEGAEAAIAINRALHAARLRE